jgi:hypothetical protein
MQNAVVWLINQQDTTDTVGPNEYGGSWQYTAGSDEYPTYTTGLALIALSFASTVPIPTTAPPTASVASAITLGREYLENAFQGPPNGVCTSLQQNITNVTNVGTTITATVGSTSQMSTGLAVEVNGLNGYTANAPIGSETVASVLSSTQFTYDVGTAPTGTYTNGGYVYDTTSEYCGGWNYTPGLGRSDESNTGYALTGLDLTGGVPLALQAIDLGWQNNDQADCTTNQAYCSGHSDGGGSYQPDYVGSPGDEFSSNSNDSGTLLYSYAYDGLTSADSRVQAAMQFDTDVLDTFEKTNHGAVPGCALADGTPGGDGCQMIYHAGTAEDGSCDAGGTGCDWDVSSPSEGGFHYSMFTLSKGLGEFIPPDLSDGSNWYAKIADLLTTQQDTDPDDGITQFGAWPPNGRDDDSASGLDIFSSGLSIFALGLVAVPPPPIGAPTVTSASPSCTQVAVNWTNPTTPNFGGVWIQRSTTGFPANPTDGTRVADVLAPSDSYTNTGLTQGTTYYYALFAHDTTEDAYSAGTDFTATPSCQAFNPNGYRIAAADGGAFDYGIQFDGSLAGTTLNAPIVGLANEPGPNGYLMVGSDGGVFTFGGAHFYGSLGGQSLASPIAGIATTPNGGGYWLVSKAGQTYNFGNAPYIGSLSGLNAPIVGIATDPSGQGAWLVGSDGGVFALGNANFEGSLGNQHLNAPIVGIAPAPNGEGYVLAAADGGVFAFPNSLYHGSVPGVLQPGQVLNAPVVGIAETHSGQGYWLAAADGGLFCFGDAPFLGNFYTQHQPGQVLNAPMVGIQHLGNTPT